MVEASQILRKKLERYILQKQKTRVHKLATLHCFSNNHGSMDEGPWFEKV